MGKEPICIICMAPQTTKNSWNFNVQNGTKQSRELAYNDEKECDTHLKTID